VFSNEIEGSPKGILPGAPVELTDFRGETLAFGYGHPRSLICFRRLAARPTSFDENFFYELFVQAWERRKQRGWIGFSLRLVHAEGDGISGLVVDAFVLHNQAGAVLVVQPSTSGAEVLLPNILEGLKRFTPHMTKTLNISDEFISIVVSRNSRARTLDGLEIGGREVVQELPGVDLEAANILVPYLKGSSVLKADLVTGQKTGFFLDQGFNIFRTLEILGQQNWEGREVRVLDLCCYLGQWGQRLAQFFKEHGARCSVDLVDVSEQALTLAKQNVAPYAERVDTHKIDVTKSLNAIVGTYDVVVCDPPAFIKKRADLPIGTAAYVKLNREAAKRLAPQGLFVTCSCSGLLGRLEFERAVADGSRKALVPLELIDRGGHGPDHPVMLQFPEGEYLKALFLRPRFAP